MRPLRFQVAFVHGSLFWFEGVPPSLQSNTPAVAMVDLQSFDDDLGGPSGPAAVAPGTIGVSLPTPAALASPESRVQGFIRAATTLGGDGAPPWTDHVVVYNLHAPGGTGVVQVTLSASNADGNSSSSVPVGAAERGCGGRAGRGPTPSDALLTARSWSWWWCCATSGLRCETSSRHVPSCSARRGPRT